jgi:hypothetical protein
VVKLLERLKGGGNWSWKVGDTHEVVIDRPSDQTIKPGSRFILFFSDDARVDTLPYDTFSGCSPLPLNETNLELVRRGISQDYSAWEVREGETWP